MKRILKNVYTFCCKLFETLISIVSVILFSSFKGTKYFQLQRKKRAKGESCTILGNGASLNAFLESKPSTIKNVMVVNFFGNTKQFRELKPDMYIVLDNILTGRAERKFNVDKVKMLYKNIQSVDWPLTFYFPSNGDKKIIHSLEKNKNINVVVYNMTPVSGFRSIAHWLYKKSLGMPFPNNISNAAVFCALNSGFEKVYLYGVEHSWMKSIDVDPCSHRIFLNDGHFYEKDNIQWFPKGEYCRRLLDVHKALKSHFLLREYANKLGCKIINKTDASFVEAYEFEEY